VNKLLLRGISLAATAAVIAVVSYGASAQEKKAPAKKPPACNTLKAETACKARNDCNWVAESKDAKGKVKRKAYCRANPAPKKDDAKKK
jgi:hypothetical protein